MEGVSARTGRHLSRLGSTGRQFGRLPVVPGPLRAEVDEVEAVDGLRLASSPGPHGGFGVAPE